MTPADDSQPIGRMPSFDWACVLIDWNPRYLYRQLFETATKGGWSGSPTVTNNRNGNPPPGCRPAIGEAIDALVREHPEPGRS